MVENNYINKIKNNHNLLSYKDLLGFALEERLEQRKRRGYSIGGLPSGLHKLMSDNVPPETVYETTFS